jgi:hypothetical protein
MIITAKTPTKPPIDNKLSKKRERKKYFSERYQEKKQ